MSYFNGTLTIESTRGMFEAPLKLGTVRVNTISNGRIPLKNKYRYFKLNSLLLLDDGQGMKYQTVEYKSTVDGIELNSLKLIKNGKHVINLY